MKRSLAWGLGTCVCICAVIVGFYISLKEESSANEVEISALTKERCLGQLHEDFTRECYTFVTQPDKQFRLPVHVLKNNRTPANTLVVYVPGGPGQGGLTDDFNLDVWVDWLLGQDVSVDMLFYDPRGTLGASPNMRCEQYNDRVRELLAQSPDLSEEYSLLNEEVGECWARYRKNFDEPYRDEVAAARLFSSHVQAQDIIHIVEHFEYDNILLWGVSYGTRLSLLAAKHPSIDGVILDGVYPFDDGTKSDWIGIYEGSFRQLDKLYHAREKKAFPTYLALFDAASGVLKDNPRTVVVERWREMTKFAFVLNSTRLIDVAFSLGYTPQLREDFFSGLEQLVHSDTVSSELTDVVEVLYNNINTDGFSPLTYFLVECTDNFQEGDDVVEAVLDSLSQLKPHLKPYFAPELERDVCRYLNIPTLDAGIHDQSYADKPIVVFSGEYDHVTPRTNVEKLAKRASGPMAVLEMPKTGHGGAHLLTSCDWGAIFSFASSGRRDGTPFCSEVIEWR